MDGDVVTLSGNVTAGEVTAPATSLTQVCASSSYSYTIAKTTDGTYNLSLKQTSAASIDSASVALAWTLDTVAPHTTFTSQPASNNLTKTASFAFSASESGVTFACKLDSAAYATCASPVTLSSLSNGTHTYTVRATDTAGNVETSPASYTWTQQVYNAIALYHFDTSPGATVDSGLYSATYSNGLTDTSTSAGSSAKFAQSRKFIAASSSSMATTYNASLNTTATTMTVEAFVRFTTLPTSGAYMTIASQMGAAGQYGWELRLKKSGSKYALAFAVSQDGTTAPKEVASSSFSASTSSFQHLAVTWNAGAVKFYVNGTAKGSTTNGLTKIFASTAPLRLGRDQVGNYLDGTMDEFRLSQIVRWNTNFTAPTSAYSAD
jgi:hypothetical protein